MKMKNGIIVGHNILNNAIFTPHEPKAVSPHPSYIIEMSGTGCGSA
jgi:hypothetical protein